MRGGPGFLCDRALGFCHDGEPAGFIASVLGAVIVLFIYGLIQSRRSS